MKILFGVLAVIGTILPLSQFLPWLYEHGLQLDLLLQEAFQPNIAAFAWLDVIVSAIVVLILIFWEGRRLNMERLWLPALGTCTVGVSLGLPLFLMMRESKIQKSN